MQKLEKIILQCLADLEQDGHLDQLESHGGTAKLICKTVRQVVSSAKQTGVIDNSNNGGE
ncbi:hypothetical protein HIMB100_00012410 [SAR116 cluster alpha proteobacterium HIMB100]|nr:hypothetical protein HIMB100_00012410 [SAR116 cluster alpha proteobacterium HIMB100]